MIPILLASGAGPLALAGLLAAVRPILVAGIIRLSWMRAERPGSAQARAADAVWISTLRALNAARRNDHPAVAR